MKLPFVRINFVNMKALMKFWIIDKNKKSKNANPCNVETNYFARLQVKENTNK